MFESGGISLVAKRPSPAHIEEICRILPNLTQIYLSADQHAPADLLVEGATKLVASGFCPIPHVAVRMFANDVALDAFLQRISKAGVTEVFVIAGDVHPPAGALENSLQLLEGPLLHKHGLVDVGIAGYPEGHPELPDEILEQSLEEKIRVAEQSGFRVHIATQFSFHVPAIANWIDNLRQRGIRNLIKIGIPGPSNPSTLRTYAAACGVVTSPLQYRPDASSSEVNPVWTPDKLINQLAQDCSRRDLGDTKLNLFAFGGLSRCARWLVNRSLQEKAPHAPE